MKTLERLEHINAFLISWSNKLIVKQKVNNRMLIFAEMGIGDLLMFMPTIQEVLKLRFEITFYVERSVQKEILKKHFPQCSFEISGKYGWCLMNFQTIRKKEYIIKVVKLRIPNRVGHSFGKWASFFNLPVAFDINRGNQVLNNLELLTQFNVPFYSLSDKIFIETEKIGLPFEKYICIAPFLYTDPRKRVNCYDSIIEKGENIVLLGSIEEFEPCQTMCEKAPERIVNMAGKTSIFQAAYIIKNADHFYSHEGGLGHVAAAMETPSTIYYYSYISKEHVFHRGYPNMNYVEISNY
jgi:heptosyltransferase II